MSRRDGIVARFVKTTDRAIGEMSDEQVVELYQIDAMTPEQVREHAISALRRSHWLTAELRAVRRGDA